MAVDIIPIYQAKSKDPKQNIVKVFFSSPLFLNGEIYKNKTSRVDWL